MALIKIGFQRIIKCSKKYLKKQALVLITGSPVRHFMTKELVFCEYGDPIKVLKMKERTIPPLTAECVLVRMIAAPINPADINTIQGKYPIKLSLPCVAGNEGVGFVQQIGSAVSNIRLGDKVIITKPAQGTWAKFGIFHQCMLRVVPRDLPIVEAATLTVNPCTAYRILTDFKPLRKCGGVVIQNGANSACGQNIIQLCYAWCIKTINIVRNRPNINDLKYYLCSLGATFVLTEEELQSTNIFAEGLTEQPSLAINCVGGKKSLELLRHLEPSGSMVTYGGMSKQPVTVPSSAFIFKDFAFYGFWMTAWNELATEKAKNDMLSEITKMMMEKKIVAPAHKKYKLENYEEAFCAPQGFRGKKFILDFS